MIAIGNGIFPGLIIKEDTDSDTDWEQARIDINKQLNDAEEIASIKERFIRNERNGYVVGSYWRNGEQWVQYQRITHITEDGYPNAVQMLFNPNGSITVNVDTYAGHETSIQISEYEWNLKLNKLTELIKQIQ